ncbi:TPA: hypothetical protein OUD88_002879 [Enterobacter hormaechei]|nr:hypothetical protein [Enterobacter hormaechei]
MKRLLIGLALVVSCTAHADDYIDCIGASGEHTNFSSATTQNGILSFTGKNGLGIVGKPNESDGSSVYVVNGGEAYYTILWMNERYTAVTIRQNVRPMLETFICENKR